MTSARVGVERNINIAAASEERVKFPYNCVVFETICSHTACIASLHRFKRRLVLRKFPDVPGNVYIFTVPRYLIVCRAKVMVSEPKTIK